MVSPARTGVVPDHEAATPRRRRTNDRNHRVLARRSRADANRRSPAGVRRGNHRVRGGSFEALLARDACCAVSTIPVAIRKTDPQDLRSDPLAVHREDSDQCGLSPPPRIGQTDCRDCSALWLPRPKRLHTRLSNGHRTLPAGISPPGTIASVRPHAKRPSLLRQFFLTRSAASATTFSGETVDFNTQANLTCAKSRTGSGVPTLAALAQFAL